MIGKAVGSYTITGKLGHGGMGAVYLAEHTLIGRKAAIKVLLPELSHNQEVVGRLFTEARATTAIKHPGIIEVFDFGFHHDGRAYLVMEYLEGESLRDRLRRLGKLDPIDAVDLVKEINSALEAAHGKGIVHRDLKPDNLFMVGNPDGGERLKVLDFGIAKLAADEGDGSYRTRTGAVLGTPAYMAPEQCKGAGEVDTRADFYSLGCILYHLLCGRPPFKAPGNGEVLAAHIYEEPTPPSVYEPSVWPELEDVVLRLLAKDPDARYQSATEIHASLDGAIAASGRKRGPTRRWPRSPIDTIETRADPSREFVPPQHGEATTLSSASVSHSGTTDVGASRGAFWRWTIAAGAVAAVAGVVIAMSVGDDGGTLAADAKSPPAEATAADQRPSGDGDAKTAAVDEQRPLEARVEPPEPVPEPATEPALPKEVTIELRSKPGGATVYLHFDGRSFDVAGKRVGKTPYEVTVPRFDGDLAFRVERRRYKGKVVSVSGREDHRVTVELTRARRGESERAPAVVRDPSTSLVRAAAKPEPTAVEPEPPVRAPKPEREIDDEQEILEPTFGKKRKP